MKFGENLQNLRKSKKMSQEQLAEKVDVSRQSVSKWERGESYPTMNNIMTLCHIFHCKINDLVHDSLTDIKSLDEEIKMNVIKFKEKKQKQMKGMSKTVYMIARIFQIFIVMGIVLSCVVAISTPIILNNVEISEETVVLFGKSYDYEIDNHTIVINGNKIELATTTNLEEYITSHSILYHVMATEFVIICMIFTLVLGYILLKYLEKLFINIYNENTPFVLENVKYIKKNCITINCTSAITRYNGNNI